MQTKGGIPLRKLFFFLDNNLFFVPKDRLSIDKKLVVAFKHMQKRN